MAPDSEVGRPRVRVALGSRVTFERITTFHPIQRRYSAEDLLRLRRSDEKRRYIAPQRAARIDPNPHQIDAVVFALSRLREGGCILADEVGLGKTIEAGLVIAQLLAEGARRILLVTPKPLLGQWMQEGIGGLLQTPPQSKGLARPRVHSTRTSHRQRN